MWYNGKKQTTRRHTPWKNPKLTASTRWQKAKAIGLTERETAERDALRKEYLADMRAAFKQQLDSTYVQTADGAKIPYAEYAKLSKH